MKALIFKTNKSLAPVLLRLFLAFVIFPHGAQKLMGWFGGAGLQGSMKYFTESQGLAAPVGLLVIIIEFFGPVALVAGFATRLWSVALAIVMTGIILTNFTGYFFMNWFGNHETEGMEFFLLAIGMAVSLVYSGAGRFSVDALIGNQSSNDNKQRPLYQAAME